MTIYNESEALMQRFYRAGVEKKDRNGLLPLLSKDFKANLVFNRTEIAYPSGEEYFASLRSEEFKNISGVIHKRYPYYYTELKWTISGKFRYLTTFYFTLILEEGVPKISEVTETIEIKNGYKFNTKARKREKI